MNKQAFFLFDSIQVCEETSPGKMEMSLIEPGDEGYEDAYALAVALGEVPQPTPSEPPLSLESAKQRAIIQVDARRGQERRRYIKDVFGQEMVYAEKRAEAVEMLADPQPLEENYPILYLEAAGTIVNNKPLTPYQLAQIYLNMADIWKKVCAIIERRVAEAQTAIESATSVDEALSIPDSFAACLVADLSANGFVT